MPGYRTAVGEGVDTLVGYSEAVDAWTRVLGHHQVGRRSSGLRLTDRYSFAVRSRHRLRLAHGLGRESGHAPDCGGKDPRRERGVISGLVMQSLVGPQVRRTVSAAVFGPSARCIVRGVIVDQRRTRLAKTESYGRAKMIPSPADSAAAPQVLGSSRWADMAWAIFLVLGVLIALIGIGQIVAGFTYDDIGGRAMGYHILFMVTGGVLIAIGLLHLVVARSIRRHRPFGRTVGIVIAVIGTLLGAYLAPSAITLKYRSIPGTEATVAEPDAYAISIALFGVAYAIALVGLILGGKHFKLQPLSASEIAPRAAEPIG